MPEHANANAALGIKVKLAIAFLLIAITTAIVGMAGWYGFDRVQQRVDAVIERQMPAMINVMQLRARVQNLISTAPRIIAAEEENRRKEVAGVLRDELNAVRQNLEDINKKNGGNDGQTQSYEINSYIGELESQLETLISATGKRNKILNNILETRKDIYQQQASVDDLLLELIDTKVFDISIAVRKIEETTSSFKSFINKDVGHMRKLLTLRANMSAFGGVLIAASSANRQSALVPIKEQADGRIQAARKELNAVSSKLGDEQVKQIKQLMRFHDDENSVVDKRRKALMAEKRAEKAFEQARGIADKLKQTTRKLVEERRTHMEESAQEAAGVVTSSKIIQSGLTGAILVTLLAVQLYIARRVSGPLVEQISAIQRLSNHDMDVDIRHNERTDEIGQLAGAMTVFRDNLRDAERLRKEREEADKRQAEETQKQREDLADQFNSQVGDIIKQVDSAAQELQGMAQTLASAVDQTTKQSNSVASAAEEASTNVQTVASSVEEMTSSIQEITQNVSNTADSAKRCAETAEDSKGKLDELQKAIGEIDTVIDQINNVAEQTNMLALNATIEAARAGDAGKGFAVVANEVKTLAGQTHEMTDEISKKVAHVKSSADGTISSVNDIISQIENVDEKTTTVSSAVEEQNTATDEISRNVQEASQGTSEVAQNVEGIQQAANESSSATDQLKNSSDNLAKQSQSLQRAVDDFLKKIREG